MRVTQLVATIDDPENQRLRPATVRKAMETLGALRAVAGVDVLTAHIAFPDVKHSELGVLPVDVRGGLFSVPIERRLPAAPALIQIGEPCVPKVIARLVGSNRTEHDACVAVLRGLSALPSVRDALAAAIEEAPPDQRGPLERALEDLTSESD